MDILSLKALHFIGFVAWFAGLFYLPRLMVYHVEALTSKKVNCEVLAAQYSSMEQRLFKIIMRPAMVITFIGGIGMLVVNPEYLQEGWLHVKLVLVLLLAAYSESLPRMLRKLAKGEIPLSSDRMRLFNEIPTLILVTIVLLAVFRGALPGWQILLIVLGLVLFIIVASRAYKKVRMKKGEN